ncbi:MAG: hypothetical protein LAP87_07605 [Acidobacteriia bacterium]|nr:hypothetical protein [Terriglobia bacterium]
MLHLLVLAGVFALALQAQSSNGYLFFAPGGVTCCGTTSMTLHAGVGGEGVIGKGIGIGAELGAVGPRDELADSVGMFSPNGYYHFVHRKELKADPFVTAGYTLMFRSGHANLFNFGTGLNYWFLNHLGARVEFRDHVYHSGRAVHYWGVRFGLAFR